MLSEPLLMRSSSKGAEVVYIRPYGKCMQVVVRTYGALCMFRKGGRNNFLSPEEGTGEPLPRDSEC